MKQKEETAKTVVKDSTFIGVEFKADGTECLKTMAEALRQNAEALSKMATILQGGGIHIDSLLSIQSPK